MDPRMREDDTGRGMDPRVREDDGKYVVMSAPFVVAALSSFLRRQESIPVFFSTVKPP